MVSLLLTAILANGSVAPAPVAPGGSTLSAPTMQFPGLCLIKKDLPCRITGNPGTSTLMILGTQLLNPPVGGLYIAPPQIILSLGKMPASGEKTFDLRVPSDPALIGLTFYAQSLVDLKFSDLARKRVGPHHDRRSRSQVELQVRLGDRVRRLRQRRLRRPVHRGAAQ
jgi:hypothetical protein